MRFIEHAIGGETRAEHFAIRATLLDKLRYNRTLNETPGVLRKVFPGGDVRDIDVFVTGGMTLDEGEHPHRGCWHSRDVVEFTAYNPIFYDPTPDTDQITVQGINELVFPIDFPVTFGGNIIEDSTVIDYGGTWETWPTIEITGPVNSPVVINETSGKYIRVNYKVSDGEVVTIVTDPFNMSVTNDNGDSLEGNCDGSDLTTFVLLPSPNNENTITFRGGAKYTTATCDITWLNRYIGY